MPTNNAAPDSIDDGRLRTGTKLTPAAQVIQTFRGASREDVAEAQKGNSYKQLGDAVATFAGTAGVTLTRDAARKQYEADLIAGEAKSRELQAKNIRSLDDAVKSGELPAGASPAFMQALREHQLGAAADKRKQSLSEAYWNSDEGATVRNSEDIGLFNSFVTKHNAAFDKGVLTKGDDGEKSFTDLDIHKSKYAERADQDTNALYREHLNYRVGENEKAAEQVAGLRTTRAIEDGLDNNLSHAQIAQAISGIYRDPNTGLVTHGMKASKQSELTTDAVVDAAIARRDIKVLDMVDSIPTGGDNFLGGTSYARKKVEAARSLITQEVWMEGERNRTMAERRGAGIATDPETEARAKETRDRHEAEYAVKVKQLSQTSSALEKSAQAEPEQAAIIQHLANGSGAFDHEVVGHMKTLAKVDPTAAQHMMTFVQGQQLKQRTANDEKATLSTYTRLRADLSSDPSNFDRGRIVLESNRGNLTSGQVSSLFENAESQTKAAKEYPILQSDIIKQMRTDIRAASLTNPLDEFGAGRLRADAASSEFNDLVLDYVRTHPEAGAYEISKAMRPEVERLARRHNAELDQTMTQNETRAANERLHADQGRAKAEREASFNQPSKPLTTAEKRAKLEGKK